MSLPSFQDFLEKTACFVVAYDSLWTFHVHVEDVLQIVGLIVVKSEQKGYLPLHETFRHGEGLALCKITGGGHEEHRRIISRYM